MVVGFGTSSEITGKNRQDSQLASATDFGQVHQQLADNFKDLQDPRGKQGVLHPFISIVMIALLATIGGATGWEDIETYGVSHQSWLSSFLQLPFGIPSADTYRRLFERISPKEFECSFNNWLNSLVLDLKAQVIPIDGKTLKGSYDRNQEQSALHIEQMGGLYKQSQWSGLQTIVKVVRTRHLWNKTTQEVMFYLSSLPADAQKIGLAIRQNWSIENQLHWVLDVTFNEDACPIRKDNSPENFALLKRWSINFLNKEISYKRSIRQKAKQASMDQGYMLKVLQASIPLHSNSSQV
ncbi:ISAs1 family transposase [Nostoc sp. CHAB 5836]|uniref:ISAs1 family transposase n=1 Tax=Nostoc sp. CHAB 5836 TaxID=2780404 RepID=UPI001E5DF214|nr:ISAs1 family transposase [Nostoc sp. CHAB 5836]MCC5617623.1 ISAs1 family transposase [Nostoc sp. CHAB 5836]